MSKNYFNIEEFLIDPSAPLPLDVINKLLDYHIPVLNNVRRILATPVIISQNSGYRPYEWEIAHGRSGNSEHTFKGKGAVDVTAKDIELLFRVMKRMPYTRVCLYKTENFVHCDYKSTKKQSYINTEIGWQPL